MAFTATFGRATVTVPNRIIQGNEQEAAPVRFHIVMASGPDMARLKSILLSNLGTFGKDFDDWDQKVQTSVMSAFAVGAEAFQRTIKQIDNYSCEVALCRHVGMLSAFDASAKDGPAALPDDASYPIVDGQSFTKVAPYGFNMLLATWVALEITKLTESKQIDPRFFVLRSGSSTPAPLEPTGSSAKRARTRRAPRATAGSK